MYISTTFYLNVNHAFLNGQGNVKRGAGEITQVKQFGTDHGTVPYVSAQAFRKWIRTTVTELAGQNYYYHRLGKKLNLSKKMKKTPEKVWVDPISYIEDDMFGYSHPLMETPEQDEPTHMKVVSMNRLSPYQSTMIVPLEGTFYIQNYDGWVAPEGDTSLPFNTQIMGGLFEGSATLDLNRIGSFDIYGDIIELDPDIASYYEEKGELQKIEMEDKIRYQYTDHVKRKLEASKYYFDSLLNISGGAKSSQFLADLTPRIVLTCLLKGATNLFHGAIDGGETISVSVDKLKERLDNMAHLVGSDVFIGYRSGTLGSSAEKIIRDLDGVLCCGDYSFRVVTPGEAFRKLHDRVKEVIN